MAPRLEVQELLDAIIDHLRDSQDDLKSCSLVCRSFLHHTQSLFFHTVKIASYGKSSGKRLAEILSSSPHLIRHIRNLECDVLALSSIARICWTNVQEVTFRKFGHWNAPRAIQDSIAAHIQAFVRHSSLRTVRFTDFSALARPCLWRVLAHCGPEFNTIEFAYVYWSWEISTNDYARPETNFLYIDSITLAANTMNQGIAALSVEAMSPQVFSALMHIRAEASDGPDLTKFLRCNRRIQTRLNLTTYPGRSVIDLRLFAGLTRIELDEQGAPFDAMFSRLEQNNHLDTILFSCRYRNPRCLEILRGLEATLLATPLPELRCVEVEVRGDTTECDRWEFRRLVHAQLSRLQGQFRVSFRLS
ncbi:hypothetical protein B0H11DRAFT_57783 [Mycena galericulata]|nr:hypothetical protein B0H11DRAFT_57783 [Mycena galericulata]